VTRHYTETEVVARVRGLTVASLRSYTAIRCVRPELRDGRLTFSEADLARLRLLCELGDDFDLDEESSALVLSLIDQIHGLRRELRTLALALADEPEEVRSRIRARVETRPPAGR
jgi:chaperone modulatory protein CbpM